MKTYRQNLGVWGEQQAANYLLDRGYTILSRNVRTPYGEIDLIGLAPEAAGGNLSGDLAEPVLVFIEVKTRRSTNFGLPEDAITSKKRAHLLAAVQSYMLEHPELPGNWRMDVISIQPDHESGSPAITHFENAFS